MTPQGTVLVIDDNPKNLELCQINLEDEGFEVMTAENGRLGLEAARQREPDAILLDIMMPVMDGFETLRHIKADVDLSHVPVLMLTARAGVEDVVRALEAGANDYLRKPYEIEEMVARVGTLVSLKKAQQEIRENHRRMAGELSLANNLQQSLLPTESSLEELVRMGVSAYAFTRPATEVNGDLYQIKAVESQFVTAALIDCKGHGVSAGMMTMAVQSLLSSVAPVLPSAAEPLNYLNQLLRNIAPNSEFAGIVYLYFDAITGEVLISQGGTPNPLLFKKSAGLLQELELPAGPPLGLPRNQGGYQEISFTLDPGDKLILFSDGLTEAMDSEENFFGIPGEKLIEKIEMHRALPARELGPKIIEAWDNFSGADQSDDCSLLILERI